MPPGLGYKFGKKPAKAFKGSGTGKGPGQRKNRRRPGRQHKLDRVVRKRRGTK